MARYHINYQGNPGACDAKYNCPFGDEQDHYKSKAEARVGYEIYMAGLEAARKDTEYAHREDNPTPNSAWNKFSRLKKIVAEEYGEFFLAWQINAAKEELMEDFGPVELYYLSQKKWPDPEAQVLAKDEIHKRKSVKTYPN